MRTFNMSRRMAVSLILSTLLVTVTPFNLDTTNTVIQERPGQSCDQECMFGFSVAQHSEAGVPWLLIGAPRANSGQPGIHKGGAVYKCPAMQQGNCQIIPFDKGGDALTPTGKKYDEKSGQWFGAVVQSSGADGTVLACAPRYIWYSRNGKRREPIGTCFTTKNNLEEFFEYAPCKTRNWGYHRQGSCQAGIGAAVSENGDQIYVGAVGSWYWQGQVFSMNLDMRSTKKTQEGDPQDDDSYLGYSVATGEFNGDGDKMDVAVGMPRGANLTGKVVLYDSNLVNLNNLTGTQIGAYFGYSLATADLNGDGLHDLVIGAPMWTDYSAMGKFETGRVYVVYQSKEHRFRDHDTLDGKTHKARFGLSLANAGDINIDGYQDIAIGAPYDGPDGKGAVYIYLGSIDGVMEKHSQVIYASDLNPMLSTFGWSISGGMDMDNNKYPDLLVGAYDSGHAVHLRAAPVVHMEAIISYERPSKQIDLDDLSCKLSDRRTSVPCVFVSVSLKYTGMGVPNLLEFDLEYLLDAKKDKQKRLFLLDAEGTSSMTKRIQIRKEQEYKDRFRVYLLGPNIKDKLTSLDVQVKYSLADTNVRRGELVPVLRLGNYMASDSLNIQKDCGPDNKCVPDLSLSIKPIESYLMGSEDKLEIQADIINRGEDAFNAILEVHVPRGVNYVNANTGGSGVSILCSSPNPRNNNTLSCEVGNPLKAGSTVALSIVLQPQTEGLMEPISEFAFHVASKSSNPEEGSDADNTFTLTVPIRVETDFRVTGLSIPDQVQFNVSEPLPDKYEFVEEIGEVVTHVYDVRNRGPSSISEAEVYILWPSFNDYGDHLLYLLGFEYDTTRAKCEPLKNLNPLSLKSQMSYSSAQEGEAPDVTHGAGGRGKATVDVSGGGAGGSGFRVSVNSGGSSVSSSSGFSTTGGRAQPVDEDYIVDEDDDVYETRIGNRFDSTYTRTQQQSQFGTGSRNFGLRPSINVADGAEETRLFDQSRAAAKSANQNKNENYASGSNYATNTLDTDVSKGGWRRLPNGTHIREYQSSSSVVATGGSASSGRSSVGSENGAGYSQSSSSSDSDWVQQPDGTWIRKTSSSSTYSSQSSSSYGGGSSGGSSYGASGSSYGAAGSSYGAAGSSYGAAGSSYDAASSSRNSEASSFSVGSNQQGSVGSIGVLMNAAQGPGDYHGTMSKAELEREAGGAIFNAAAGTETRDQVEKTRYQGSVASSGGSAASSSGATRFSGEGEDYVTTSRGRWVWSETNKKWEWEEGNYGGVAASQASQGGQQQFSSTSQQQYSSSQQQQQQGNQNAGGQSDSGWTQLPNGQYVRKVSNWSSQSGGSNYQAAGGRGSGANTDYFESGNIGFRQQQSGNDNQQQSGSTDSGWTQLPNGTYVRRQESWSATSRMSGQGSGGNFQAGYGQGSVLPSSQEHGDDGHNTTGWVRQPDGTMVMRNSAWSSWSSTGSGDYPDGQALQNIQRQLENRARTRLQNLPSNVEPGFEDQYVRTHREVHNRKKRDITEFHSALAECEPEKCTIIKCTMGPMEKDEQLLLKVKSRIFTETLVKNYAEKVTVSSKLLTRVTKLPFTVDEEMLAFQSQSVTTTVIPTEPGEAGTPWWVWLLAILLGLTVLGALTYCLYKCGFFKRNRRMDSGPEAEPLRNGYH